MTFKVTQTQCYWCQSTGHIWFSTSILLQHILYHFIYITSCFIDPEQDSQGPVLFTEDSVIGASCIGCQSSTESSLSCAASSTPSTIVAARHTCRKQYSQSAPADHVPGFRQLPPHWWTTLYHGCARSSASVLSLMQVLPLGTRCRTTSALWLIQSISENCWNLIILELLLVFAELFMLLWTVFISVFMRVYVSSLTSVMHLCTT